MRKQVTNKSVVNIGVLSRLTGDKKKTVAAVCLIGLMVFMWVRVLTRKPEGAEAGQNALVVNDTVSVSEAILKVSFVDLPRIEGRHDVLSRDFFASNNWRAFIGDNGAGTGKLNVKVSASDKLAERIAEKLQVETIWIGSKRQVVINDKLLSIGDTIEIKQGEVVYECEVVEIEDNRVLITFGESQIELSLIRTNES